MMLDKKQNINWYVLYSRPRAEKKLEQGLQDIGLETFCPTRTVMRQWSDRRKKVEQVLFTSYVFVKTSVKDFNMIYNVNGFVRFVNYLGRPAIVRDKEIEAIKTFLEMTTDHSIHFEKDSKVMITVGPLKGKTGLIEKIGKTKLRIFIEELGMSMVAVVHKNKVEAI